MKCFALTLDNCFNVSMPPDVTAHVRYKDSEVSKVTNEAALLNGLYQLCVHFYTCVQYNCNVSLATFGSRA